MLRKIQKNQVISMLWAIYNDDSDVSLDLRIRAIIAVCCEFAVGCTAETALVTMLGRSGVTYADFRGALDLCFKWPVAVY